MSRQRRWRWLGAACGLVLALVPTAGCGEHFSSRRSVELEVPAERLHNIEMLDLEAMSVPAEKVELAPGEAPVPEVPSKEVALSLQQCRAAALEHNLDLEVALINPTIARQQITEEEARFEALFLANLSTANTDQPISSTLEASQNEIVSAGAGLRIPLKTGGTISFDLPYRRFETNNVFTILNPSYTANFVATITQPLLRNAGVRTNTHAIRIARYQSQIVDAGTKLEVIRLIAEVDRLYWRLYDARSQLEVRRNEHDLAVAQLERARRMVKAGVASEVEVISAETGVAERLESVILAGNVVRRRERDLKRTLNMPGLRVGTPTVILPATMPRTVSYNLDRPRMVEAAVESRMEMLELELQIAQDTSTVDFARNQTLPLLALSYTYQVSGLGASSGDAYDVLVDKRFEDHRLGLQLQVPVGNRAARSRLRRALFTRVRRLATRQARELEIEQQVLDAVDQLETNWQRVIANRKRTALAERNLEGQVRQFELGLQTSTEVLEAQTRLADAQSAEISSLVEYQIAQVDLAFATGTLLGAARVSWEPTVPPTDTR